MLPGIQGIHPVIGASATPNPISISGMSFWYDIQDASTIFQDDALTTPGANNQPVGGVTDKSGNGRTISNVGSGRPTLKSGTFQFLDFDGVDDSLVYVGTNVPCGTVFVVGAIIGSSNDAGLLTNRTDQGANVDIALKKNGATDSWSVSQSAGNTLSDSSHIWENRVQTVNYNAAGVTKIWVVDGTGFPASLLLPTGISVGNDRQTAFRHLNVDVLEIIGYGSVLSTADRNAVEQYLATKYGIAL